MRELFYKDRKKYLVVVAILQYFIRGPNHPSGAT
jgi:hypothetical protein